MRGEAGLKGAYMRSRVCGERRRLAGRQIDHRLESVAAISEARELLNRVEAALEQATLHGRLANRIAERRQTPAPEVA